MPKFIYLFFACAILLLSSCNNNATKINKTDYNQQEFDWTIASSAKAVWSGEHITSTNGSENPEDYNIILENQGSDRVKLTIDEKAVSDAMWESMPNKAVRYKINFNLPPNYQFVGRKGIMNIFQSNPPADKFGVNSTFSVNCSEHSDQIDEINYHIYAESNLIKEYEFSSHGFEKAVKHITCQ